MKLSKAQTGRGFSEHPIRTLELNFVKFATGLYTRCEQTVDPLQ